MGNGSGRAIREWKGRMAGSLFWGRGGPLMLPARGTERWGIIGTVYGGGYNCKTGKTSKFEGEEVGIWNKVSAHTEWILDQLEEKDDDDDDDKTTTTRSPSITTLGNGTSFLVRPPAIVGDQPGGDEPAQAHSEAGADYSGGPQYGRFYRGAGFAG